MMVDGSTTACGVFNHFKRKKYSLTPLLRDHLSAPKLLAAIALRHQWCDQPITMICAALIRPHPAFPGLLRFIRARAKARGSSEVKTLLRPHTFEYAAVADLGWTPQPSHFRLVCGVYRDDVTVERLHDGWHTTLGDYDVC